MGHIERKEKGAVVNRAWTQEEQAKRPEGSTKLRYKDVVTKVVEEKGLRVEDTRDRTLWRRKIQSAYPLIDQARKEDVYL